MLLTAFIKAVKGEKYLKRGDASPRHKIKEKRRKIGVLKSTAMPKKYYIYSTKTDMKPT